MKQRLCNAFLVLFCLSTVGCARAQTVVGVWENWELYSRWKSGAVDELIVPRDIVVNGTTYVGFTDSVLISSEYLSVPGGKWRIRETMQSGKDRVDLLLSARGDSQSTGIVTVTFLGPDSIYFTSGRMDDRFRRELEQSFLMPGKENYLIRCKRK